MHTSVSKYGQVFVDHYAALGLTIESDVQAVKTNFRRLAKRHHPDSGRGNSLKFLEIYNAYKILSAPGSRNQYNSQYIRYTNQGLQDFTKKESASPVNIIPPSRLHYPRKIELLARTGLLRERFREKDKRMAALHINYDVEAILHKEELVQSLELFIPVIARTICPDCRGSDMHCHACRGRGSYKNARLIRLILEGGLMDGQILEIDLQKLRLESLSHFKKKRLRLKITVKEKH